MLTVHWICTPIKHLCRHEWLSQFICFIDVKVRGGHFFNLLFAEIKMLPRWKGVLDPFFFFLVSTYLFYGATSFCSCLAKQTQWRQFWNGKFLINGVSFEKNKPPCVSYSLRELSQPTWNKLCIFYVGCFSFKTNVYNEKQNLVQLICSTNSCHRQLGKNCSKLSVSMPQWQLQLGVLKEEKYKAFIVLKNSRSSPSQNSLEVLWSSLSLFPVCSSEGGNKVTYFFQII